MLSSFEHDEVAVAILDRRFDTELFVRKDEQDLNKAIKLSLGYMKSLDAAYPQLTEKSQDVIDDGTIIPEVDYQGIWGYLVQIVKQINRSYEENIFDGCAVLMRLTFIRQIPHPLQGCFPIAG